MDVIDWLLNNGSVLDGTVIINIVVVALIFELFGLCGYWLRRF